MTPNRLVAVVIEVTDLERSAALYRDGFGVPLKDPDDHAGEEAIHGLKTRPRGRSARYRAYDGNVIELTQRT
jgi:catechol 2,3-dioxygenase-like lactoylglutathione lyase family enzyme